MVPMAEFQSADRRRLKGIVEDKDMIDLRSLLAKFKKVGDRETTDAFYLTNVPWVARDAYLHIIYKAAPAEVRAFVDRQLNFPSSLGEFYVRWNGARLFLPRVLAIYGCLPEHYLLDRKNPFKSLPFNVLEVNREVGRGLRQRNLIAIGSYSFDESLVCMERDSEEIQCFFGEDFTRQRKSWPSLDDWITQEIIRLSLFFDEEGRLLVDEEQLLPGYPTHGNFVA
jgi:hypothetical protein